MEITKTIDQIDKKLLGVLILETLPTNKSSRIQTLDKASEVSSDGEEKKIKAIKTVANWKAP